MTSPSNELSEISCQQEEVLPQSELMRETSVFCKNNTFGFLFVVMILTGCTAPRALKEFDRAESEALSMGIIAAGGANVIDYDDPKQKKARDALLVRLDRLSDIFGEKSFSITRVWDNSSNSITVSATGTLHSPDLNSILPASTNKLTEATSPSKPTSPVQQTNSSASGSKSPGDGANNTATNTTGKVTGSSTNTVKAEQTITKQINPEQKEPNKATNDAFTLVQPINPLDELRLRMAFYKFVQEQRDILSLDLPDSQTNSYRRVLLTVQLAASVNSAKAAGALVYFDMYPKGVDIWCHDQTNIFDHNTWSNALHDLEERAFTTNSLQKQFQDYTKLWVSTNITSGITNRVYPRVADRHRFLQEKDLCPRIVYVEPLDDGEVVNANFQNNRANSEAFSLGAPIGAFAASIGASRSHMELAGTEYTDVDYPSLAFVAGPFRAGWSFSPQPINNSYKSEFRRSMKRVQRQVRMVVDVPRNLERLTLFVHKTFLNDSSKPIKEAAFSKQLRELNRLRATLDVLENMYPGKQKEGASFLEVGTINDTNFISRTHWSLAKSRVRSSLAATWSDELDITIPAPGNPTRRPIQNPESK
jgi:hypothetical protein